MALIREPMWDPVVNETQLENGNEIGRNRQERRRRKWLQEVVGLNQTD